MPTEPRERRDSAEVSPRATCRSETRPPYGPPPCSVPWRGGRRSGRHPAPPPAPAPPAPSVAASVAASVATSEHFPACLAPRTHRGFLAHCPWPRGALRSDRCLLPADRCLLPSRYESQAAAVCMPSVCPPARSALLVQFSTHPSVKHVCPQRLYLDRISPISRCLGSPSIMPRSHAGSRAKGPVGGLPWCVSLYRCCNASISAAAWPSPPAPSPRRGGRGRGGGRCLCFSCSCCCLHQRSWLDLAPALVSARPQYSHSQRLAPPPPARAPPPPVGSAAPPLGKKSAPRLGGKLRWRQPAAHEGTAHPSRSFSASYARAAASSPSKSPSGRTTPPSLISACQRPSHVLLTPRKMEPLRLLRWDRLLCCPAGGRRHGSSHQCRPAVAAAGICWERRRGQPGRPRRKKFARASQRKGWHKKSRGTHMLISSCRLRVGRSVLGFEVFRG